MVNQLIMALLASAATAHPTRRATCPDIRATMVVERLSGLPEDIRDNLLTAYRGIGDRGSELLATDAPSTAEMKYPTKRCFQAVLIKDVWYVQIEVAMTSGVRTIGFNGGTDGHFRFAPSVYYGGPACETPKAAINGVYNPGTPYR